MRRCVYECKCKYEKNMNAHTHTHTHTQDDTHTSWLWALIWDHDKHAADGARREREWGRPGTLKASLQTHLPFWALGSFGLAWNSDALASLIGPCVPVASVLDCSGRWLANCRQKLKLSKPASHDLLCPEKPYWVKCFAPLPRLVQQPSPSPSPCCAQIKHC